MSPTITVRPIWNKWTSVLSTQKRALLNPLFAVQEKGINISSKIDTNNYKQAPTRLVGWPSDWTRRSNIIKSVQQKKNGKIGSGKNTNAGFSCVLLLGQSTFSSLRCARASSSSRCWGVWPFCRLGNHLDVSKDSCTAVHVACAHSSSTSLQSNHCKHQGSTQRCFFCAKHMLKVYNRRLFKTALEAALSASKNFPAPSVSKAGEPFLGLEPITCIVEAPPSQICVPFVGNRARQLHVLLAIVGVDDIDQSSKIINKTGTTFAPPKLYQAILNRGVSSSCRETAIRSASLALASASPWKLSTDQFTCPFFELRKL